MRTLLDEQLFMPVEDEKNEIEGFQKSTQAKPLTLETEDGNTVLILFTSPERAKPFVANIPGYTGGLLAEIGWILERVGGGIGIAINPSHEVGLDLDEDMVRRARRRLAGYGPERLELCLGDVTRIDAADQAFDAVVNFAAIHHVPDWQAAVAEIYRVLKPGGRFFFQEVTARWILRWPYRTLFKHPMENRFSGQQFIAELQRQGIEVGDNWVERGSGDFIFGVGQRAVSNEASNRQAGAESVHEQNG